MKNTDSEQALKVVHRISCAIARSSNIQEVYELLLDEVQRILRVEKASIMLLEPKKQVLRLVAARGLDPAVVKEEVLVPIGEGVSGRVFQSSKPLLIKNIKTTSIRKRALKKYKTDSLISAPVRCFPLKVGSQPLGVINVTDKANGRPFTPADLRLLTTLANQAASYLHICQLGEKLKVAERWQHQLALAEQIQKSLFPLKPPILPGLDFAGHCLTAEKVGGDYYDLFVNSLKQPSFMMADISGHSLGSALTMSSLRSVLRAQLEADLRPAEVIWRANRILYEDLASAEQVISLVCLQYDSQNSAVRFCNAGHPPPLLKRVGSQNLVKLVTDNPLLGLKADMEYQEARLPVQLGDVILFYTDGVTETINPQGERFGKKRLEEVFENLAQAKAKAIVEGILKPVTSFAQGLPLKDDVTVMVIKFL